MPSFTTNYALRYPTAAEAADGPTGIGNLATDVDTTLLAQLAKLPKGIIARGDRASTSSTTISEIGVLRLDNIAITAGRLYIIKTGPLPLTSNTAGDVVFANIRTAVGGTATTGSSLVGGQRLQWAVTSADVTNPRSASMLQPYAAPSNGTLSVLLTVGRASGSGIVSINASLGGGIDMWVEDAGIDPGDTGIDI